MTIDLPSSRQLAGTVWNDASTATRLLGVLLFFLLNFASLTVPAQEPPPPSRDHLRTLLDSGSFAQLDAEMSSYQTAYGNGVISDEQASRALIALKQNDPDLRPAYDRWVAERPTSYVARLARGYFLMSLGNLARGSDYAARTPNARFQDMERLFEQAMTDLEASLQLDQRPTLSYGPMIVIAKVRGDRESARELLGRAIALDPAVYTARLSYLGLLQPEWGGSLEEMAAFIAAAGGSISKGQLEKLERRLDDSKRRAELAPAARLVAERQYEAAIRAYDAALEREPSARAFSMRGYAYAQLNRHDRAIEDFSRALELDPDGVCCSGTRSNRANSYLRIGAIARGTPDLVLAAEDDDHWAARELAMMYAFGKYGTKPDAAAAKRWCERAAKQVDGIAMYCLGGLYHAGMGVTKDPTQAAKWFELAAERRIADAQADIAFMYWEGEGVAQNLPRAVYWWLLAAAQGNERARTKLVSNVVVPVSVFLLLCLGYVGYVIFRKRSKPPGQG